MDERYTIGGFCFRLTAPEALTPPENFQKFRGGEQESYTYHISFCEALPPVQGEILLHRDDLIITRENGLESRWIGVKGVPHPYACYREISPREAVVDLDRQRWEAMASLDVVFVSLLALEKRMAAQGALVLHCAWLDHPQGAVLFSGPSGAGKSTQADLWRTFRGRETVNGDRALLRRIQGRWVVQGWPVCGSSGICRNESQSLRAIVMVEQAPENAARSLRPGQAFHQVYTQMTVNRWDRAAALQAVELTEDLITRVSVGALRCTMEEGAVQALEAWLAERE